MSRKLLSLSAMFLALVTVVYASGCSRRLNVPIASEVQKVSWRVNGDDPFSERPAITENRTISDLVELINSENKWWRAWWRSTWNTFPTPQHSLVLYGADDDALLVVWIGVDWIGGRNGGEDSDDNRLHSISDERIEQFLAVLNQSTNT